jgi:hypothetical protein
VRGRRPTETTGLVVIGVHTPEFSFSALSAPGTGSPVIARSGSAIGRATAPKELASRFRPESRFCFRVKAEVFLVPYSGGADHAGTQRGPARPPRLLAIRDAAQ